MKLTLDPAVTAPLEEALRKGYLIRAFRSGGGLRVLRMEDHGTLKAYGESPNIKDAFRILAEDATAGGRP